MKFLFQIRKNSLDASVLPVDVQYVAQGFSGDA